MYDIGFNDDFDAGGRIRAAETVCGLVRQTDTSITRRMDNVDFMDCDCCGYGIFGLCIDKSGKVLGKGD